MRKFLNIFAVTLVTFTLSTAAFAADTAAAPASASSAVATAPSGTVNINTAETVQLAYLPRVGVKAAQAIVDYRKEHGPFKKTTDLLQVKGFGEKRFKTLSPWVTIDGKTTLASKAHLASSRKSSRGPRSKQPASSAS